MKKNVVTGKKRVWCVQRSYTYESQTTCETEAQWMDRIRSEWDLNNLRSKTIAIISSTLIFHDNDYEDDGNPKPLHAHSIIECKDHSGIDQATAMRLFGASCPENCEPPRVSKSSAYLYLTHTSADAIAKCKTRYELDKLRIQLMPEEEAIYKAGRRGLIEFYYQVCSHIKVKNMDAKKKETQKKAVDSYVLAIGRGQLTAAQAYDLIERDDALVDFTPTDAQKIEPSLKQAEAKFRDRFRDYCMLNDMCKTSIYIAGAGDRGKSTLCKAFAAVHDPDGRGYHMIAAKGKNTSFDMADGYNMEAVTIANEVSGRMFSVEQFLDVFDPKGATKANSRNTDKFYAPSYILMNNSVDLETFIYDLCFWPLWEQLQCADPQACGVVGNANRVAYMNAHGHSLANKALQVRRRIAIYCVINNGRVDVYYRVDAYNKPEFYAFIGYPQECPYRYFGSELYNADDPQTIANAVKLLDDAISAYYDVNGYTVNPLNSGRIHALQSLGDLVELPGHRRNDIGVSVDPSRLVTFNGKQYTIDDFNKLLDLYVTTLEKYTIGDKMYLNGQIVVQSWWYVANINRLFWAEATQRVCYPEIFGRFLDIRKARKEAETWPIRRK